MNDKKGLTGGAKARGSILARRDGLRVVWIAGHETAETTRLMSACPKCGAHAVAGLPPWELAKQTDGTTHACVPALGGCNWGFSIVSDPAVSIDDLAGFGGAPPAAGT